MGVLERFEERFGAAGKPLSRLIRPMFAAPEGRTLVWGDWSNIEARKLPWLADNPGARDVLEVFRESDRDKSKPDIYCREAAGIEGVPMEEVWERYQEKDPWAKAARQTGKVAVLSLGFGGSVGALQAMAANYGLSLLESEAKVIVGAWRDNNPWARRFWDELWEAMLNAFEAPGTIYTAGRVSFLFDRDHGRTMFMFLPDGRPIAYPRLKWREREIENEKGEVEKKTQLTYMRGYEMRSLWYGILAENATQGAAGSLLRETLTEIEPAPTLPDLDADEAHTSLLMPGAYIVGHTHDEIIAECDDEEEAIADTRGVLHDEMTRNSDWNEGCPLAADLTNHWYYTKTID